MAVMVAINFYLIRFRYAKQEEIHIWFCKPKQKSGTVEIIDPRRESTAIFLLLLLLSRYEVAVSLPSKYLYLLPYIMSAVSLSIEGQFLIKLLRIRNSCCWMVVEHTFNPCTGEAEAG